MSSKLRQYLSLQIRKLIPNRQQLADGGARFVALFLVYSMTASAGLAAGITQPDGGRYRNEARRIELPIERETAPQLLQDIQKSTRESTIDASRAVGAQRLIAFASPQAQAQSAMPVIQSMSPNGVPAGQTISVSGSNFGSSPGTLTVGGIAVATSWWSGGGLGFQVPATARTGANNVVVTTTVGSSAPATLNVLFAPAITNLSPAIGVPNTQVTVSGGGFGTNIAGTVSFNGVAAQILSWTDTKIVVTAPNGAAGQGPVVVSWQGVNSNGITFNYIPSLFYLSNSTVERYYGSFAIVGENFLATPPGTVTLNGIPLKIYSWSNNSISLPVPQDNCTGPMVVTTQYGASNAVTLTINGSTPGCTSANHPPVANAGPSQTVYVGSSVQLDGSGSTDQDGDSLTYRWALVSAPPASAATLTNATTPKPSFVADKAGSYTAQLIVNDGHVDGAASLVVISTKNSAPVANAGPNQTVPTQTLVQLNGSGSSDVDGDVLTYGWSFVSRPANSHATLTNATAVNPTFTTDVKGTYKVQLVVNDGQVNGAPATVVISDVNTSPVANAGASQTIEIGSTVQLNGSGSTDVDGDVLTYRWSMLNAPAGSTATLSGTSLVNPSFKADAPGDFVVQLIVNDGTADSVPATVTVSTKNSPPAANAGAAQTVAIGALVSLDGSGSSDPDGQTLTYKWSILSTPAGSKTTLSLPTAPNPAFTADKNGTYVVQLIVNDGYVNSPPSTVTISTMNSAPVADAGPVQIVTLSSTVNLTGAASNDADGDPLTYRWSMLSQPAGATAVLSDTTVGKPSFVANVAGAYVVQLIVNDGFVDSAPKTVMITAAAPNAAPVVGAGPDQTVYSPNSVILAGIVTDDGLPVGATLSIQWSLVSGPGNATFANANSAATTVSFDQTGIYVLRLSANDTQLTSSSTCTITYISSSSKPPVVSAGPNQTVPIPNNLPLQGSATSANNPAGIIRAQWSVISTAPAGLAVSFSNATSPTSTVSLASAGAYVLQLTGTESGLSASSQLTITAQQGNQPPAVNTGPNQTIALPANAILSGSATDDGLPAGSVLSYLWTQLSGPTGAVFVQPTSLATTIIFQQSGTYVFRLTVSDSQLTGSAQVRVVVLQHNNPPAVSAGANQIVSFPNSTILNGSASDDGLPVGGGLTSLWSIVSSPGSVIFSNLNSPVTTATFGAVGTYVLRLSASDTQYTVSSDVTVTVAVTAPAEDAPPVVNAGQNQTIIVSPDSTNYPLVPTLQSINTGVAAASGVDYHSPTNKILVAVNGTTGTPNNFALVAADGSQTQFSNVSGITGTLNFTAARDEGSGMSRGGFHAGEVLAGSGIAGQIIRISPDGSAVRAPWVTLPGETGLLAQLWLDRTGVWGGDLIASTSTGAVWRVNVTGAATKIANLGAPSLNGLLTVPNDQLLYGPWAGVILAGSSSQSNLFAININGTITKYALGIAASTLRIVNPSENYFVTSSSGQMSAIPAAELTGMIGDILVGNGSDGKLWIVHWTGLLFETTGFATVPGLIGSTFAPAGLVQVPAFSQTANLNGAISDDGLPIGGLLSSMWSLVSGPGTATFANASTPTTTVTLSQPGSYVLRLTGSDTQLTSSSDTTVTVASNQAPLVEPGSEQQVVYPGNVTLLGSVTDDGLPNNQLYSVWTKVAGPGAVKFDSPTYDGNADFSAQQNPNGVWSYGWTSALAGAFSLDTVSGGAVNGVQVWLSDAGFPQIISNQMSSAYQDGSPLQEAGTLRLHPSSSGAYSVLRWTAPSAGVFLVQGRFWANDIAGTTTDVHVLLNAIPLLSGLVWGPSLVANGASGSGVPFSFLRELNTGDTVDFAVGNGGNDYYCDSTGLSATITQAGAAVTAVSFSSPGDYDLRLLGYDGQLSSFKDVRVHVQSNGPTAPVVNAGPDQTIALPNSATLNGTATDPFGNRLSIQWSQVSGPGVVAFTVTTWEGKFPNSTSLSLNAAFSAPGVYVLRLSATSPLASSSSDVTITVNDTPYNQPPTVSAGANQEITLPNASTLNGTVTDDGLPLGAPLTQRWTQISDPAINPASGYASGQIIVLDHTKVPNTDQQDFPVLISGTFPYLATVTNGGQVQNSSGYDIEFTSDAAGQVRMDFEIDSYDPGTGIAAFWVRIPTLSHTADTTIYMWYGNSAIVASQENKSGVWKNGFVGVYHFSNAPNLNATDSLNINNGTNQGVTPGAGMIGGSGSFDGATSYIALPAAAFGNYPTNGSTTTYAMSFDTWFKTPSSGVILGQDDGTTPGSSSFYGGWIPAIYVDTAGHVRASLFDASAPQLVSSGLYNDNQWHSLAATYNNGTEILYVDGVALGTQNGPEQAYASSYKYFLGTGETNYWPDVLGGWSYLNGRVDETRISAAARSADWVATEYNNQSSPSTFYSFGGGLVNFSNPNAPVTQATFSAPGKYVLQLSANDTQYTSTAQVTVTVYPQQTANLPPVVSAGANQFITLPASAALNGTVTDDSLPTGATVTSQWSMLSGPAAATFANATQPSTNVYFSQAGTYVLQLSASDTQYISSSAVTITVNSVTDTKNQPPVLTSNPSSPAIVGSSVALNGTATDDGLPNGTLVVHWAQLSGPGMATFANANVAASQVIFSVAGTYVLQLSASDSQYTSSLTLTMAVLDTAPTPATTNQPPVASAGAAQTITLPTMSATLSGLVKDDGLPNNQLSILWTELSGPASVVFSTPYAASTQVTFTTNGVYLMQLSANDGQYTATSTTTVVVNAAPVTPPDGSPTPTQPVNQPPTLKVLAPGTVILPNNVVTFTSVAADDGLPAGSVLTLQWSQVSGPALAVIATPNQATTQITFAQVGSYVFKLVASDSELTTTGTWAVSVEAPAGALPVVQISLQDGTDIKSPTAITGTVSSGAWALSYAPILASGTGPYQTFASGTGPSSGVLGTLDPSVLLNGTYSIQLSTQDQWGQTAQLSTTVSVDGNLKLGNFSIAFQDLSVPLPGLPITITRTYDSRDRSLGDFGDGWRLSLANVRVQKNGGPLGQTWNEALSWSGSADAYCLQMAKNHAVTATFPDGRAYRFAPSTAKTCQAYGPLLATNMTFAQVANGASTAGAKLELLDSGEVMVDGAVPGPVNLLDYNGNFYDATQFKLTTADGYVYYLDQTLGATKVVDPNGNTLTINSNGVVSSSGAAVAFSRDSQGRISSVSDPNGALVSYAYSSGGDLMTVTDRAQNQTTFGYDNNHYLTTIKDPRGVSAIKNNYDNSGRLLSTTDANGKTITYAPNLSANQEQITDRLGNVTLYEYDNDGNITRKTDPLGHVASSTYDANDNKLSDSVYLDSHALTTSYTYDTLGDQLSVTDPLGNATSYSYNSRKQVLSVTDPLGRITSNVYDGVGNLTTTTDPNGKVTSYSTNPNGTVASVTDPLKGTTGFGYDGQGNLTSQVDAAGNSSSFTYDANNNKLTQTVTRTLANGTLQKLTTSYDYDGNNRVTKTHLADGSYTEVHYNNIGKQDQSWDAKRNQTAYAYDNDGLLTQTSYADGTSDGTIYDANGHRVSYTDRGGHATAYAYDPAGHLTTTTYANGSTSTTNYDSASRVASTVDRNGNDTSYAYDGAGRRIGVTDALNHATAFAFDNAGQQTSVTDARGNAMQYTYDADGRQIRVTYADQSYSLTGYDDLGRMTSKTDQAGVVTGYGYDSLGRLTSVTQDVGGLNLVTTYGYDQLGNRISQTDAAQRATKFAYDQLGRRSQRTLPLGQSGSYSYEANGNLSSKTDFNGKTTSYGYDATNQLLSKAPDASFHASPVRFTYTTTGKRQTMTDPSGLTTYTYDPQTDRMMSKQSPFGTISYTYDPAGNVTAISSSNANGAAVGYQYDKLNRLSTVTVAGQSPTTYGYDDVGNLSSTAYPNGVSSGYFYDVLNRLTALSAQSPLGAAASYQYTLGASGNRTGVTELSGRKVSYSYDNLYRLTAETIASDGSGMNGAVGYGYDAVGNRKSMASTLAAIPAGLLNYDANDRITSNTNDNNGNITWSAGTQESYDFENHLVGSGYMTFAYDGDGDRVSKTIGGSTTSYLVDTLNPTGYAQVLDELQSGSVARNYTWGLQLVSESQTGNSTWTTSYYGFDGHGSVRYLTDSTGTVTDTYDYDAFGNLINSVGSTPNNYRFAGEQFDPDLNLYYNRARYLDARVGRFWGMDSYGGNSQDPLSLHKYLYASGNPVNRIDPSGHDDMAEMSVSMSMNNTIQGMVGLITTAARITVVRLLTVGAALATSVFSRPGVQEELEDGGAEAIAATQNAFFEYQGVVTEVEAEGSSLWNSYEPMRQYLNQLYTRLPGVNPPNIQYHHIVEQTEEEGSGFAANAVNSMSNIIPTPSGVHSAISTFYSSPLQALNGVTPRAWMATQSWEVQWGAGLEIWKEAMTGMITWHP